MKIAITGANGYIGTHVVKKAVELGHEVIAVDRNCDRIKEKCIKITCNIFDEKKLYEFIGSPDVLIHLAWEDGFILNSYKHIENVGKHFQFLSNLINCGLKHLVVMGSMHEIGYYEGMVTEDVKLSPINLYGISKHLLRVSLDKLTYDNDFVFQWIRGFYLTGDDEMNKSVFQKILCSAEEGKKSFPFTSGKNRFDFIDVNLFAENLIKISTQTKITGIINNCSGKPTELGEKVEEFIKNNNLDIELEYGAFPERDDESTGIWGSVEKLNMVLRQEKL